MPRAALLNRGFNSLLATQFLGAANDNFLKFLLICMVITGGCWEHQLGTGGQGIVSFAFTLPFIMLSGYAGQVADRVSKRRICVWIKIVEIPIAACAGWGFYIGNLGLALGALIALGAQSAFFGPAKYGIIPELVETPQISRANGIINMLTNIAVILGTWLGGAAAVVYFNPSGTSEPWVPIAWLVGMAIAGLLVVLIMTPVPPGDRNLPFDFNPIGPYLIALRDMAKTPLLFVALAWAFFYLLAGMALLIVPEYGPILGITSEKAARILGVMAISIGLGSVAAGFLSGRSVKLSLVPVGSIGVTVSFTLLGVVTPTFTNVNIFIAIGGFFAGFYLTPLQAAMQRFSPPDERGRFLGTANALSFAFLAIASLLYRAIAPMFGAQPQRIFAVSAALMVVGTIFLLMPALKRAGVAGAHPPE